MSWHLFALPSVCATALWREVSISARWTNCVSKLERRVSILSSNFFWAGVVSNTKALGEGSSDTSIVLPRACIDVASPLVKVGVGLATGISASTGREGIMGGAATSTCISVSMLDGWIRGGESSLSNAEVGARDAWEVGTGTSTEALVGVILPSFVFWHGMVE